MGNLMEVARMAGYKKRFTLTDLAAKWNKSEKDILQKAEDGELVLSIFWSGFYNENFPEIDRSLTQDRGPLNDFVNIGPLYSTKFLELNHDQREIDKGAIEIGEECFLLNGQRINIHIPCGDEPENKTVKWFPMFAQSDVRILAEEVERFEREHPEILTEPSNLQKQNGVQEIIRGNELIYAFFEPVPPSTVESWLKKEGVIKGKITVETPKRRKHLVTITMQEAIRVKATNLKWYERKKIKKNS
jgi:hypothetical protein